MLRGGRGVTSRHLYCNIAPPQINRNISCPRSRWIYFYFVLSGAAESGHNILGHIYFIGPMLRVWQLWTLRHIEETTNKSLQLRCVVFRTRLTTCCRTTTPPWRARAAWTGGPHYIYIIYFISTLCTLYLRYLLIVRSGECLGGSYQG